MQFTRSCRQYLALGLAVLAIFSGAPQANAQDRPKVEVVPKISHSHSITSVGLSADGTRVVSGSEDKAVKLWDLATGALLRTFEGHSASVTSIVISPDGAHVLSGSGDKTVRLWNAKTGALERMFEGHAKSVSMVALSPDSTRVLSGSWDNTIRLWDANTGALLRILVGHSQGVSSVAFSADGTRVLSGSADKTIRLWDANTGALLRIFVGHSYGVRSVAFSADGTRVLSGGGDSKVRLWHVATGRLLRKFEGHSRWIQSVAISSDNTRVLSAGDDTTKLWDVATGKLLWSFEGHYYDRVRAAAFLPGGPRVLSATGTMQVASDSTMRLWDAATGALLRTFADYSGRVRSVAFSSDGARLLSGSQDTLVRLWDVTTGAMLHSFKGHSWVVSSVAFSPDGNRVLAGSWDKKIAIWKWEAATGTLRWHTHEAHSEPVASVAFSPDGTRVLSGSWDKTVRLWDATKFARIRQFEGHSHSVTSVAFSPDGARVLSGSGDKTIRLWNAETGALLRIFEGHSDWVRSVAFSPDGTRVLSGSNDKTIRLWDAETGASLRIFQGHSDSVASVAFSRHGNRVLSGSNNGAIVLWDEATGELLRTFNGHSGVVWSVAFSPDDRVAISGGDDATFRIWDTVTGAQLATLFGGRDGQWLAMTPAGFFASSRDGKEILGVVRGLDVTTIDQVHQSLFNPDLVQAALAGDPEGEVAEAAKVINLEKVLDSGPAPLVAIASPAQGGRSATDLITVTARIEDRGKGIGRIEWRINGITAAVAAKPPGRGPAYSVTQQLALDPGDNTIEVVAYNASNLLASLPARTTINFTGSADRAKPKLHILAVGINAYVDKGWAPPGSAPLAFAPLGLAVKDATVFGASMKKAAAGLYGEVRVTLALDKDATRDKLEKTVAKIAREIHPRDSFILFAAGHGTSENGRFYLIPQDYQSGPGNLARRAIGQDRLQDWLANRIKARRAIILLDTCESGALVAGHARSRADAPASEAAVGRLHEATGRPVLTAAAAGQFAHEGLVGESGERHGVFTWAVLDALRRGDTNGNGLIELSELVRHVQSVVPNVAAGMVRAATSEPVFGKQAARFGSRGEDFALAHRLQ